MDVLHLPGPWGLVLRYLGGSLGNFDGWCWYLYDIGVGILGGAMWRLYSYEWPDSCDRSALPPAALGGAGRSSAQPAQLKIQHDPQHYTKLHQLKANIIKIFLQKIL